MHAPSRRHRSLKIAPLQDTRQSIVQDQLAMASSSMPLSPIEALPEKVVKIIVQQLRSKDVGSLTLASKALYRWGNSMSTIEVYALNVKKHALASLLRFVAKRVPALKVCTSCCSLPAPS